jgi:hypothetical protein
MRGGKRCLPGGTREDMAYLIPFQEGNESRPLCYPYKQGGYCCEEQLPRDAVPQPQGSKGRVALCLIQDTIETVRNNMECFTKCEVREAKAAHEAQGLLGHPMDREFLGMVRLNMISNCSIIENTVQMQT